MLERIFTNPDVFYIPIFFPLMSSHISSTVCIEISALMESSFSFLHFVVMLRSCSSKISWVLSSSKETDSGILHSCTFMIDFE